MKKADLTDLTFDEEDLKLFNITSNLHLKAQAIRYSIVPKLGVLLEAALSQVYAVYGIAVFDEHSIKTSSPNYRRETTATTIDYDSAFVGIGGARGPFWNGLVLSNGKPIKIIPYRFGFELSDEGLKLFFDHRRGKLLATKSIRKYFSFFRGNWSKIQTIMSHSDMLLHFNFDSVQGNYVRPFEQILEGFQTPDDFLDFYRCLKCPIDIFDLESIIRSFVIFFPIYDSVLRLSLGIDDRFDQLLGILNRFLTDYYESEETPDAAPETAEPEIFDTNAAAVAVDALKVRVGLRWQVFDRDNFRCVVCGRTAHDGIILHVDHITPRSLGGPDELDNFQTLCHLCNLGKSNKSDRDLRKKAD